jgi:hypothetical protein
MSGETVMKPFVLAISILALTAMLGSTAIAANTVIIKNTGPAPVQIGFDRTAAQTIAPRASATLTLNPGQHTAQCRYEGAYDGCNIQDQFALGDGRKFTMELHPVYTLKHAIELAQQGALRVETRRDTVWATKAQDVAGAAEDCANYQSGKLAEITTKLRSGMVFDSVAVATQHLCEEARPVVSATVDGAQIYVQPNFVIFREASGRAVAVRQ